MTLRSLLCTSTGKEYLMIPEQESVRILGLGRISRNVSNAARLCIGGRNYVITGGSVSDYFSRRIRGPQAMVEKDCIKVAANFLTNTSKVIHEAGTGNGLMTFFLCSFFPDCEIRTYEKRDDYYSIAEKNLKTFEFRNLRMYKEDILDCEGTITNLFLDVGNSQEILSILWPKIEVGSTVQLFVPNLTQVQSLGDQFGPLKTVEIIEREYLIKGRIAKPINTSQHSGFLVLLKKGLLSETEDIQEVITDKETDEEMNRNRKETL